jgi:glucokinase
MLSKGIGAPVFLLNDARMAALGELHYGWGRGRLSPTFALLTLGTGVGGGVVVDGRLRLGTLGSAGELGHLTVDPDGTRCGCGGRGCLETVASGPAIVGEALRLIRSGQATALKASVGDDLSRLDPELIGAAASAGDEAARFLVERAGRALGLAIAGLVLTLHPEGVVLGGGVAAIGDLLYQTIGDELRARVRMFPVDDVLLAESPLEGEGGALGGVALARCEGNV